MPARLKQVIQLVVVQVHAAGGHLVQQRLPQVRAGLVHQRDQRLLAAAQRVSQARGELQTARAAAHDDHPVQTGIACDISHRPRCRRSSSREDRRNRLRRWSIGARHSARGDSRNDRGRYAASRTRRAALGRLLSKDRSAAAIDSRSAHPAGAISPPEPASGNSAARDPASCRTGPTSRYWPPRRRKCPRASPPRCRAER